MTTSPDQQTRWVALVLLFSAGALAAFQFAKIPFMLPGLAEQVVMGPLQQATLLSVIGVIGAVAGTFAGAVCQSLGLRRTLLTGLLVAISGALLPLWVTDYSLLLMARLVEGVGHMAIVVSVPTLMLPLCAPVDRPRVMALWSCYFTMTFVLAALLAPGLLDSAGWQGFPVLHAVLLLAVAAGLWRIEGLDVQLSSDKTGRADRQPALSPRQLLAAQWRLLSQRKLLAIPASFLGYTLLFVTLVSALPRLITASESAALSFALILPCAALFGTVIALTLLARGVAGQQLVNVAVWGLALTGSALLLLSAPGLAVQGVVIVVFVLLGLLPAGIISSLPRLFDANDPDIALVNGGLVQFGNLGNFIGAPLLAAMLLAWGWVSVGLYLLLGAVIVGVCLLFVYPQAARHPL